MSDSVLCFHCGKASASTPRVQFRDTCAQCSTDLHVCRNCRFYDPGAHHECKEPGAEWVREKERANRCEYFRVGGSTSAATSIDNARKALDDLFKK